jgi:REP element-mobilizing transposase RayT
MMRYLGWSGSAQGSRAKVLEIWGIAPQKFPMHQLDAFIIMPNHVHFFISLPTGDVGVTVDPRLYGHIL